MPVRLRHEHVDCMSTQLPRSPLAPAIFPSLPALAGVRVSAAYVGVRYKPGRDDLLIVQCAPGTTMAGVYTQSRTASPAVHWCRRVAQAAEGSARALLVVAGNSFAGTGADGDEACVAMASAVAHQMGCAPQEVQISATGVIGEPMPVERVCAAIPAVLAQEGDWHQAARAIITTDTFAKGAHQVAMIAGQPVQILGFCKGSGMIMPNMATMLGYLFTDARLPASVLHACLVEAVETSFNCITVDSDTSTSDTVQLFATGCGAPHPEVTSVDDPALKEFRAKLSAVCLDLAWQVVRDGEGAQKFITITVTGARDGASARALGFSIANSPLVKTAIAGADANWGRVVMAVGKSGEPIDPDKIQIRFGGTTICQNGVRVPHYDETPVVAHLQGRDISIAVDVGVGNGTATVYTCDLTQGYIQINGDYRS